MKNTLWWILIVAIAGCAPRDNPFDPRSQFAFANLSGRVFDLRGETPLCDIWISVDDSDITLTDSSGTFEFYLNSGTHSVKVRGEGIADYDTVLTLAKGEFDTLYLHVDRLPHISEVKLTSVHLASVIWGDDYMLNASCRVTDPDGVYEIDSVLLDLPDTVFIMEAANMDSFSIIVPESLLPEGQLHELVGTPIYIVAKDIHGGMEVSEPIYLSRIIYEIPEAVSPSGGVVTPNRPVLIWHSMDVNYSVSYEIELYSAPVGQPPSLIMRVSSIEDTVFQIPEAIPPGYYYWFVFGVDEFGNKSRSIGSLFVVQ